MAENEQSGFSIELDAEVAAKFSKILNDESVMHASVVAHEANNDLIGRDIPSAR